MNDLLNKITQEMASFKTSADQRVSGNKAAGARSRKTSLVIAELLKEWRKLSVKA